MISGVYFNGFYWILLNCDGKMHSMRTHFAVGRVPANRFIEAGYQINNL
jgi:hypothetical protein